MLKKEPVHPGQRTKGRRKNETTVDFYERKFQKYFSELVPGAGKCETVQGECLRAIAKIRYRYYNDGDYYYRGYGCTTAGPPHAYLTECEIVPEEIRHMVNDSMPATSWPGGLNGLCVSNCYDVALEEVMVGLVMWLDGDIFVEGDDQNKLLPNDIDMYSVNPVFESEED